jgi:2'-5' RNA ligase
MVNELNSELAMEFASRLKAGNRSDRQMLLATLRQIHITLRPLSKTDRREKIAIKQKAAEFTSGGKN